MTKVQDQDPRLAALRDFVVTEAAYQHAKEAYSSARKAVLNLLPSEVGEFELEVTPFKLTVKYPEKIVWDKVELDALYGSDKPDFVKASYSIDLRDLRRLPEAERDILAKCHQIKPGTPVIDVEKI